MNAALDPRSPKGHLLHRASALDPRSPRHGCVAGQVDAGPHTDLGENWAAAVVADQTNVIVSV